MQSPGPPYQGPSLGSDLYSNRSYENQLLNSQSLPNNNNSSSSGNNNNNYLSYQSHSQSSHAHVSHAAHPPQSPSVSVTYSHSHNNYNNVPQTATHTQTQSHSHSSSHYNSSPIYGTPVNHYSDMYTCGTPRNVYAANIPIRATNSSNIKYWSNSDEQMSQNSHKEYNYNHNPGAQAIPPPPLVSRTQPPISSPSILHSQCNTTNNYTTVSGHHSSSSPQGWSRSPNVMRSPSTTPSPLPPHPPLPPHTPHTPHPPHIQSPTHISQQFSPSVMNESSQHQTHQAMQKSQVVYTNQNSSSSQDTNCSNPLQSLQKMVMIDSDNTDIRSGYDNIAASNAQNNGNANMMQRPYNSVDQNVNNDPDSPYPTYYNLDQNRLCTPPRPSPNSSSLTTPSFPNIPDGRTDSFVSNDGLIYENENELKKESSESIETKTIDLISFECNPDIATPKSELNMKVLNSNDNCDANANGKNCAEDVKNIDSSMSKTTVCPNINTNEPNAEQRNPAICRRTSSRDSTQSSDSETAHSYSDSRSTHWQINQIEKSEYFNSQLETKNTWWPRNNYPQKSQSLLMQPQAHPQPPPPPPSNSCIPPECAPSPSYSSSMSYQSPVTWTNSSNSTPHSLPSNKHFASPKSPKDKKKRGRPFGSKNRARDSEDTGSETATSEKQSPIKRKKVISTEEIGVNTTVSIDIHGFDELAVVNPVKNVSKRKKQMGPFIRIEKGRGIKSTSYSIVNASNKPEDEKDVKGKMHLASNMSNKQVKRHSIIGASKKVVSTLSPHYDLNTRDKSWVCALCHKGPHFKGLGDLYGPYLVSSDEKDKVSNQNALHYDSIDETIDSVVANELSLSNEKKGKNSPDKRKKSDCSDVSEVVATTSSKKQKQTSRSATNTNTNSLNSNESSQLHTNSQNLQKEVWVHEDCIVWSSGVYLVGHRVRNLEEIITDSNESICTKCKLSGATLGCLQKSCNNSQFHYLCAKEKGCDMDEENFSLHCPKHKKKAKEVSKCNSDEPSIS